MCICICMCVCVCVCVCVYTHTHSHTPCLSCCLCIYICFTLALLRLYLYYNIYNIYNIGIYSYWESCRRKALHIQALWGSTKAPGARVSRAFCTKAFHSNALLRDLALVFTGAARLQLVANALLLLYIVRLYSGSIKAPGTGVYRGCSTKTFWSRLFEDSRKKWSIW